MPDKTKRKVGYELALDAVGGNASELARRAGVTPQSVLLWKKSGVIPPEAGEGAGVDDRHSSKAFESGGVWLGACYGIQECFSCSHERHR